MASLVAQSRGATPKELDVLTCDLGGPGCDSAYVDALCDAYGLVPLHIAAHATRNAAPLSLVMDDTDKVRHFRDNALTMGLEVLPPDVNASNYRFEPVDAGTIRYGLGGIKGTGQAAMVARRGQSA